MSKQYFEELDVLKGGAILLIILLHSRCEFPLDIIHSEDMKYVNGLIAFMSPNALFFFASGFLFRHSDDTKKFLSKKTARLLIPMFFFAMISVTLRLVASNYTRSHIDNPIGAYCSIFVGKYYWFLYALFIMLCIKNFINRRIECFLCAFLLFYTVFFLIEMNQFNIFQKVSYYYIWFTLGSIIGPSSYYKKFKNIIEKNKVASFLAAITLLIICVHLCSVEIHINPYLMYFVPLLSIYVSIVLSIIFKNNMMLSFWGRFTLQYYLNHILILLACFYVGAYVYKLMPNYLVAYGTILTCTILVSTLMLYFEVRIKKLHFLFGLGKR